MGFTVAVAEAALEKCNGNVEEAVAYILEVQTLTLNQTYRHLSIILPGNMSTLE